MKGDGLSYPVSQVIGGEFSSSDDEDEAILGYDEERNIASASTNSSSRGESEGLLRNREICSGE
jgi:hypothetical protein